MSKQHKWHKEIKAWADGEEIEFKATNGQWYYVSNPFWESKDDKFRIKPQPKEPKYLYAWKCEGQVLFSDFNNVNEKLKTHYQYIGKIKLEVDDE